ITEDFFRVGGDSILSIQLSTKLRKSGYECSVRDIFDSRNVSKLAKYIESTVNSEIAIIKEEGLLTGEIGLLPIQQWFFDKIHSN
ncbi:phosphopantetheine-binding protein, partial [Francisella philomiragia]